MSYLKGAVSDKVHEITILKQRVKSANNKMIVKEEEVWSMHKQMLDTYQELMDLKRQFQQELTSLKEGITQLGLMHGAETAGDGYAGGSGQGRAPMFGFGSSYPYGPQYPQANDMAQNRDGGSGSGSGKRKQQVQFHPLPSTTSSQGARAKASVAQHRTMSDALGNLIGVNQDVDSDENYVNWYPPAPISNVTSTGNANGNTMTINPSWPQCQRNDQGKTDFTNSNFPHNRGGRGGSGHGGIQY